MIVNLKEVKGELIAGYSELFYDDIDMKTPMISQST